MASEVVIDGDNGARLVLSARRPTPDGREPESFHAGYSGEGLEAGTRVYGYLNGADLPRLFARMHQEWPNWRSLGWVSLEGEFGLEATHDSTGHISLQVMLRTDRWKMTSEMTLELGQIESLAVALRDFWEMR